MFKGLQETIKALNADVNNVTNCEKAKKLRKNLLLIGLPIAIIGFLGMFTCITLFVINCVGSRPDFTTTTFPTKILVPFLLIIPCFAIGGIGSSIASLGFKIVITGYTTNLINETVGNNCPNCGETIGSEMYFCSKCGAKVRKECSNCKHINNYKSYYCEKCGTKLD